MPQSLDKKQSSESSSSLKLPVFKVVFMLQTIFVCSIVCKQSILVSQVETHFIYLVRQKHNQVMELVTENRTRFKMAEKTYHCYNDFLY